MLRNLRSVRFLSSSALCAMVLSSWMMGCESEIDDKVAASVGTAKEAPVAPAATSSAWALSADSHIAWVGAKVTDDHKGGFRALSGSATVEGNALRSAEVVIETASLFADHPKLESHLKGEDFFGVSRFPKATFSITSVAASADGSHTVTGNLDLHGVKKEISFPATVTVNGTMATVAAEFTLNRKDFGMAYPGKPDDLIRDEVLVKGKLVFQG